MNKTYEKLHSTRYTTKKYTYNKNNMKKKYIYTYWWTQTQTFDEHKDRIFEGMAIVNM